MKPEGTRVWRKGMRDDETPSRARTTRRPRPRIAAAVIAATPGGTR